MAVKAYGGERQKNRWRALALAVLAESILTSFDPAVAILPATAAFALAAQALSRPPLRRTPTARNFRVL
jgi:hypothetical protein